MPTGGLIGLVLTLLWYAALGGGVFAVVHAVRQRPDAFPAVDKLTKPIWLGILGVSVLAVFFTGVTQILGLAGIVAVCVYLVDVRPRLDEITGRRY